MTIFILPYGVWGTLEIMGEEVSNFPTFD